MKSKLITSEDYWAIWLGALFLIVGFCVYVLIGGQSIREQIEDHKNILFELESEVPFKTIDWYVSNDQLKRITGSKTEIGKIVSTILGKPKTWRDNPLDSFLKFEKEISEGQKSDLEEYEKELALLRQEALEMEKSARKLNFGDRNQNSEASQAARNWHAKLVEFESFRNQLSQEKSGFNIIPKLLLLSILLAMIFGIGAYFLGHNFQKYVVAFLSVFVLAVISYTLAAQIDMKNLGISYAVWAIVIGLFISNTLGTPSWMKFAVQTEYYIKTGLVLLGAEILLGKIMAIGLPGIFVSWVVTPIVLISTYWFGQRILKIGSKTLNITVSADMSVCGVSAAIATAAACGAKKEELTLAVGLSMVFTSIMMIVMPTFINAVGIPEILGGAWIGGTIDATGAVVAAGAFLGDKALNVAATIKMIQNVLIGLIAFGVAFYWATKIDKNSETRVGASEIWKRFPKFVLGFLGASIVFSILHASLSDQFAYALIDHGIIRGFTKDLRGWLFCLAFVSIGLSVNFKELKHQFSGGKPLILYVCGQSFNLFLTLLMAYLMFYIVFPDITKLI